MHLRRSISAARVSGLASRYYRPGLGDLGDVIDDRTSDEKTYGTPFYFYSTARLAASLPTINLTPGAGVSPSATTTTGTSADLKPASHLDTLGVDYGPLPDKNVVLFGATPWPYENPLPSNTNSLKWWCMRTVPNIGAPQSARDPLEFLRSALMASDWQQVGAWYAFWMKSLYDQNYSSKNFYGIGHFNISDYKWSMINGRRVYYPFSPADYQGFYEYCYKPFAIVDLKNNKLGLGEATLVQVAQQVTGAFERTYVGVAPGWTDTQTFIASPLLFIPYGAYGTALPVDQRYAIYNQRYLNGQHAPPLWLGINVLDKVDGAEIIGATATAIVLAIAGAGAVSALLAAPVVAGGSTAGAVGSGAAAGAAGGGAAAGALTTAEVAAMLPEVVVTAASGISTGAVVAAGVGAAISAGSVIATATPPAISAPSIDPTLLPEVVVTAAPAGGAGVGTVGSALAAGAVTATTVAPAISPNTTASPPDNALSSNDNLLEEVTVTAKPPAPIPGLDLAAALGTGAAIVPEIPGVSLDAPSLNVQGNSISDKLQALIKKYGLAYVKSHLGELLAKLLGRSPTPQELDQAQTEVDAGSTLLPWAFGGLLFVGVLIAASGNKKK